MRVEDWIWERKLIIMWHTYVSEYELIQWPNSNSKSKVSCSITNKIELFAVYN